MEHGIVKSLSDDNHVFVVYHCAGMWDNYKDYTAAKTEIIDLVVGWQTIQPSMPYEEIHN
jgi:hypothetical protein